ncbi:MAG: hypothetical protein FWG57_00610 [Endomicrobia bacterium]|nr:hypothetical protein [Endomicrobiia bacterium]
MDTSEETKTKSELKQNVKKVNKSGVFAPFIINLIMFSISGSAFFVTIDSFPFTVIIFGIPAFIFLWFTIKYYVKIVTRWVVEEIKS